MKIEKYRRIATIPALNICWNVKEKKSEKYTESSINIGVHELGSDIVLVAEFSNNNSINFGFISVDQYEKDSRKFNACAIDACSIGYTDDTYYFNLPEKFLALTGNKL